MNEIFELFIKYLKAENESFPDWDYIEKTESTLWNVLKVEPQDQTLTEMDAIFKNGLERSNHDDFKGSCEIIDPIYVLFKKDERTRLYMLLHT